MSYYAKVTCPACGRPFQTPVEQVLDVRAEPEAKQRMLSGLVNVVRCPACGAAGGLNLPFIYHDPAKEVALLYLPLEAGKSEVERQKVAGALTRRLMDSLPPEERKGYLLQQETFINMETMVRRVLELDGVTEQDLEHQRKQQEFLQELLEAAPDAREQLLAENDDLVDETLFRILQYNLHLMSEAGLQAEEKFEKWQETYEYLLEHHSVGQILTQRAKVVQSFAEKPSRQTFLQALLEAPDEITVNMLVHAGLQLMDYAFFQELLQKIEGAGDEEEKTRLLDLRRRILDSREEIMNGNEALAQERLNLVQKIMSSEEPFKMARSHFSELDDAFSYVLSMRIQQAREDGDKSVFQALVRVGEVVDQLLEESMPPEVVLIRHLLMATSDEQLDQQLQENRKLLQKPFFDFLAALEEDNRQNGNSDRAEQLQKLRLKAQNYAPSAEAEPGERRSPSGLIISTKK